MLLDKLSELTSGESKILSRSHRSPALSRVMLFTSMAQITQCVTKRLLEQLALTGVPRPSKR